MQNYEKMMDKSGTRPQSPPEKRLIASPKMISKLSPALKAVGVSSPRGGMNLKPSVLNMYSGMAPNSPAPGLKGVQDMNNPQ
jgi:hypothetical protein